MSARALVLAAAILCLAVAPFVLPEFQVVLLNYIGLYTIVAIGLVLLTGVAGLTSFGQAAFVGLGAYTTAYLTTAAGWSPWLALFAGEALTVATALVIGLATLRLSGHYLPLSTIAWGLSIYYIFGNLESLGGHGGLSNIPALTIAGVPLDTPTRFYPLIWGTVLVVALLISNLLDSRPGRAIRALNGGMAMAESCGIDTARAKLAAFLISAVLASLSGWLYAHLLRFVSPTPFGFGSGVDYLFMTVVGGASHILGAVVGAGLFTVVKQALQQLAPKLIGEHGNYEAILFGILMIAILQRTRLGIADLILRLLPARDRRMDASDADTVVLPTREKPDLGTVLLAVDGITKRFGGLVAVDDLSFAVRAGEIMGLIGPNGAGKSTTFNVVCGGTRASAGFVTLLGRPVSGEPPRRVARLGLARTFQHVRLIPDMTVLDNVMIGAHGRGRRGILAACLRLNRSEESALRAEALRHLERIGLLEFRGVPAGSLALGQQRLLEVARALCADPVLLLVDEPAAGLRLGEKQRLFELFDSLKREGLGVLLVEHDMDFVMSLVDRATVMNFGKRIAHGQPAVIQADPVVREAYLGGIEVDDVAV